MSKVERKDWSKPKGADALAVAFPANVVGSLLPEWDEVPEEFNVQYRRGTGFASVVSDLFYKGGKLPQVKKGIDQKKAYSQLRACIGSWEPKHEHKIAGVAYLMSLWCELPA